MTRGRYLYDGTSGQPTGSSAADNEIRAAFAAYDRDASGGIDASELVAALAREFKRDSES